MINEVRNNVMFILNKDNRGYITPMEFNTFARQAQLDIFTKYMSEYSNAIIKQNARYHGEGYANKAKIISEFLDRFSTYSTMNANLTNGNLEVPPDCYYIEKLIYNNNTEIDRVDHSKILNLLNSNLTAPNVSYPSYILTSAGSSYIPGNITVYPNSLMNLVVPPPPPPATNAPTNVQMRYIRYPKDPMWTWNFIQGGEPLFNSTDISYKDFEIPYSELPSLVSKILQYSGMSIRESEVVQGAKAEELQTEQQTQ
jgi:hypothetical protein